MRADKGFRSRRLLARYLRNGDWPCCLRTRLESHLSSAEAGGTFLAVSQPNHHEFDRMVDHRERLRAAGRTFAWGLFQLRGGRFIGEAMLEDLDHAAGSATIGVVIHSPFRRCGYGREIVAAVLRHAFSRLGLRQVAGQVELDNDTSLRMCLDVGFVLATGDPVPTLKDGRRRPMWRILAEASAWSPCRYSTPDDAGPEPLPSGS